MKSGPERALVDDYIARFRRLGPSLGFRGLSEVDVEAGGGLAKEGGRLLAKLPGAAQAVRLDEAGQNLRSASFAERLAQWRDGGAGDVVFLIGGAEGFSETVRDAAPDAMAFGPQTWPHRLVRAMLAEQIYRAASLLAGAPYHKA